MSKMKLQGNTIGEIYAPAMEIDNEEDAKEYFELLVQKNLTFVNKDGTPKSREQAEAIERFNLGYYAKDFGYETQQRVQKLFGAIHFNFGGN